MEKRLNIITDSLGMPREVTTAPQTWTEQIAEKYKKDFVIKQFLRRNLSITEIVFYMPDFITYWTPDVLVMQIGIVDCCRRATSKRMRDILELMSRLRLGRISARIHKSRARRHYTLTKKRDIHYCSREEFSKNIEKIVAEARHDKPCEIAFIAIAPPCYELVEKTYRCIEDAAEYNEAIKSAAKRLNFTYIDPYADEKAEDIVLADGHHLTDKGHFLVRKAVDEYLQNL